MEIARFARLIAPLRDRVMLMIGRCVLSAINDAPTLQRNQITLNSEEVIDAVARLQEYGFTSVPLPGAEAVVVFLTGNRGKGIVVATDDSRYRPTGWQPGEVGIYSAHGQLIRLLADGGIEISAPGDIELRGENVRLHGRSSLIVECNGHGEKWLPTRKDTWTIGADAGDAHPINPPEIP